MAYRLVLNCDPIGTCSVAMRSTSAWIAAWDMLGLKTHTFGPKSELLASGHMDTAASSITSAGQPDFGPNVKILLQSSKVPTQPGSAAAAVSICPDASSSLFGPNVCVFNPSMSQAAIQADVDRIAALQVPIGSQFSTNRYAIFFEPGTYGSAANPLVFQVGYYTQVAGLGFMPQDTVVNGMIEVFAND